MNSFSRNVNKSPSQAVVKQLVSLYNYRLANQVVIHTQNVTQFPLSSASIREGRFMHRHIYISFNTRTHRLSTGGFSLSVTFNLETFPHNVQKFFPKLREIKTLPVIRLCKIAWSGFITMCRQFPSSIVLDFTELNL